MNGSESDSAELVELADPVPEVESSIESALRGINSELAGLHAQGKFLNEVIDRLHAENEKLRRAESQKLLQPGIRELIKLADDWRSRGAALRAKDDGSADSARLCDEVVDDVTMILDRQGIEEFLPAPGVEFDRREHRAIATRSTEDEGSDGMVAEARRPGYRSDDGRVVRFAEVVVLKFASPTG